MTTRKCFEVEIDHGYERRFISEIRQDEDKMICVVGTVVGIKAPFPSSSTNKPVVYHVDDSTGAISVLHFLSKRNSSLDASIGKPMTAFNTDDDPMALEAHSALATAQSPLPIGSCVEVRGKVQSQFSRPEILAFVMRAVKSDDEEIDWITQTLISRRRN